MGKGFEFQLRSGTFSTSDMSWPAPNFSGCLPARKTNSILDSRQLRVVLRATSASAHLVLPSPSYAEVC